MTITLQMTCVKDILTFLHFMKKERFLHVQHVAIAYPPQMIDDILR